MSLLILSDPHGHNWPRFSKVLPSGRNSRMQDLLNVFDQVLAYVDQYQPQIVIILGDVTHRRGYVLFSVLNPLMAAIERLAAKVQQVYMIPGNHDIETRGTHSLTPFQYIPKVDVIDRPEWRSLGTLGHGYFVPYMEEGVREAMHTPPPILFPGEPFAAFLHYAMDRVPLDTEYRLRSPLVEADIAQWPRVFLGHVHGPVTMGRANHVGAVMQFDFGDVGPRYCWLVDETQVLPLPLSSPRFVTSTYPRIGLKGFEAEGFLRVLNTPPSLFNDVQAQALKLGWSYVQPMEAALPDEAVQLLTSGVFLTRDLLTEYVEQRYPEVAPETRAHLVEVGLGFLTAAAV